MWLFVIFQGVLALLREISWFFPRFLAAVRYTGGSYPGCVSSTDDFYMMERDGKRCQVAKPKEGGQVDAFYYTVYIYIYIFRVDFDGGIFSSHLNKIQFCF